MTFRLEKFCAPVVLQHFIRGYCIMSTYKEGHPFSHNVDNPSQVSLHLVFVTRGEWVVRSTDTPQEQVGKVFLVKQQDNDASFSIAPNSQAYGIAFTTQGATRWIKIPLPGETNTLLPVTNNDVRFDMEQTLDVLSGDFTTPQKIAWLSSMFLLQAKDVDPYSNEMDQRMIHLDQSDRLLTIKDLMNYLNMSHRTLHRRFKTIYGLAPKQYLQIRRFQKVLDLMKQHQRLSLGDITYMCGYFDQNHFIKEFKTMTGLSPKNFIKNTPPLTGFFFKT